MASVLISLEAGVQTITLNRPEKLNAFTPEMHKELRRALEQALDDRAIRAVLLTGAGRGFCPLVRRMRELPKPIVCAVNGVAAGTARAMGLALLGEPLAAEDAERWGLIWKVCDDERLMPEASALARTLASGPTKGYASIKKALYASQGNSLDAQLDLERDLQREAGFSEDYREGVAAFMQKRAPQFKGK